MELENLTKDELKELCKAKGLQDYFTLSKPKLIRILNGLDNSEEEKLTEVVAEAIKEEPKVKAPKATKPTPIKVLSPQALKWQVHLKQINISPKEYLNRFPGHAYRNYIEELI